MGEHLISNSGLKVTKAGQLPLRRVTVPLLLPPRRSQLVETLERINRRRNTDSFLQTLSLSTTNKVFSSARSASLSRSAVYCEGKIALMRPCDSVRSVRRTAGQNEATSICDLLVRIRN